MKHTIAQTCPNCNKPMLQLFYTTTCEWCNNSPKGKFYLGYVVWLIEEEQLVYPTARYVWQTAYEATVWRSLREIEHAEVKTVLSSNPIQWREAGGKATGLYCAESLYEIYSDHRFEQKIYTAFLSYKTITTSSEYIEL